MQKLVAQTPEWIRRGFWFFLAGGAGFLLYLAISNFLHYLVGLGTVSSAVVGTLLPVAPTFWMQRRFTFRSDRPKRTTLPMYALLQVGNATLIGALTAVGARAELPGVVVFLVAGMIGTLVSYVVQANVVFRSS